MGLMDRFREAWDDLRSKPTTSDQAIDVQPSQAGATKGNDLRSQTVAHEPTAPERTTSSLMDHVAQWPKDYKAAIMPDETIQLQPLTGSLADKATTLAMESDPARIKRIASLFTPEDAAIAHSREAEYEQLVKFRNEYVNEKRYEHQLSTIVHPALQEAADKHYAGRIDRIGREVEGRVAERVATREDLDLWEVRKAASTIVLGEFEAQKRGEQERLGQSVAPHEHEFRFNAKHGDIWTFDHKFSREQIHVDQGGKLYDLKEGSLPKEVSREELISRFQNIPPARALEETSEHRHNWERLEKAFGYEGVGLIQKYSGRGDVNIYRDTIDERDHFIGADSQGRFYRVDQNDFKVEQRISRDAAMQTLGQQPHFYTPAEATPTHQDWSRLEEVVGEKKARHFTFKGENDGVQTFQHDRTGGQVNLDSAGNLYNAERQRIGRDDALAQVTSARAPEPVPALALSTEPVKAERLSIEPSIGM